MKKIQINNQCTTLFGLYLSVVNKRYFHMNQFDIFMYPLLDLFVFILFLGGVEALSV